MNQKTEEELIRAIYIELFGAEDEAAWNPLAAKPTNLLQEEIIIAIKQLKWAAKNNKRLLNEIVDQALENYTLKLKTKYRYPKHNKNTKETK